MTGRLAVCASAALLTLALATASQGGFLEHVIITQQVFKAVPAEKQKAAKAEDAKGQPAAKKTVVRQKVAAARFAGNANLIQRNAQQGMPLVGAELVFLRGICKLDQPTLAKIYPETLPVLNDVAKKISEGQFQLGRGGERPSDPTTVLLNGLAAVFKKHLTADQYRLYETESARRLESQRNAAIRFMIDVIDRELLLSTDQREKLTKSLTKNWDEGWTPYAEYMIQGNLYFPTNIDGYVKPDLNETQEKIWRTLPRVQFGLGFGHVWQHNANGLPIPALLGIETKEEIAQREQAAKQQREAIAAAQKARAQMLKKASEAKKAAGKK